MVYLAVKASESFPVGLPLPVMRVRLMNLFCDGRDKRQKEREREIGGYRKKMRAKKKV